MRHQLCLWGGFIAFKCLRAGYFKANRLHSPLGTLSLLSSLSSQGQSRTQALPPMTDQEPGSAVIILGKDLSLGKLLFSFGTFQLEELLILSSVSLNQGLGSSSASEASLQGFEHIP